MRTLGIPYYDISSYHTAPTTGYDKIIWGSPQIRFNVYLNIFNILLTVYFICLA
jgi:hypothetical protein